jgi:hypothetical protein
VNENNRAVAPESDVPRVIDIDALRDKIWDQLFKGKWAHPLDEIAALVECDVTTLRLALNHEWFRLEGDRASLSYVIGNAQLTPADKS